MRIFFSDIQKCDVWIIYCCNKLLWLWIYTTFFRCGWGEKLWQIWFLFLTTSVSSLLYCEHFCFQKWLFKKRNVSKFAMFIKKKPQVISFVFHFKQLWVFALWMLGSTVWRGSTFGTKNLQFLFFISSSLFHHQDFTSHFEIKILPINFTGKKILK